MKKNLCYFFFITFGFLLVFLSGKLLLNQNPGLSPLEWLLDTPPWNHSYLFGWLILKERFLKFAALCVLPALWGWRRFSCISFVGFTIGFFLGEGYHSLFWTNDQPGIPYSWAIWLSISLISMLTGILLELFQKK